MRNRKLLKVFYALVVVLAGVLAAYQLPQVRAAVTLNNTRIMVAVSGTLNSTLDLVTAEAPLSQRTTIDLTSGVAANQADLIWSDTRTLAASTAEDLDLKGTLTDAFGGAFTPAKLKAIYVCAAAANTNTVKVGGDAASVPWLGDVTDVVVVPPGGCYVQVAPALAGLATVTAATGDIVQVENGGAGTTVTYSIVLIGTSS